MSRSVTETPSDQAGPQDIGDLVRRAVRQDADAFADIYRLMAPRVLRYLAVRVAEREEAEDLASGVFERAFSAMDHYDPFPARFSTWLYTIARNAAIDHYRRRRLPVSDPAGEELSRITDPDADPEARVLAAERRRRLREAILELTDDQRQVIGCRFFFNLSVPEVAEALDKTEGAVKALQFRALERLRRTLGVDWVQN